MKRLLVLFSVFFLTTTLNAETQEGDYTRKKDLNTLCMWILLMIIRVMVLLM